MDWKEVIPSAFVNQAISSQSSVSGALPNDEYPDIFMSNYGYGWGISSYKGHYRVSHGGGIDGFTAVAGIFPKDSIGIVVLTNQGGSRVAGIVRGIVADRMLGTEKTNWNQKIRNDFLDRKKRNEEAEKNKESDQVAGTRPSHNLQEYTGEYNHPGYGKFRVVLRNDSVFAQFPYTDLWLDHYHYDIFASYPIEKGKVDTDTEWFKFNFRTNNIGEISSLEVEFEGSVDPIEFDHQPNLFEVEMEVLEKYVGEYELGQAKVKVYVKDNKELYMFINGQPEYQLLATGPHKFSIKILEGFKVEFVEGENGDIVELKSIQPNGTYTGKKI